MKYFIFKHAEFSRYKDVKGKVYHYDEKSPNFEKVKEGARVLLYDKETNEIFAEGIVGKIKVVEVNGKKNFFASYKRLHKFRKPIELSFRLRKGLGIRNLQLPSPGIILISEQVFNTLKEKAFKVRA